MWPEIYHPKNTAVHETQKKKIVLAFRVYTLVLEGYWLLLLFSHKPIITVL